jgi:glycosyltransferase involved in cell wall biosynthesis
MKIGFFSPTINRIGGSEWVTLNMVNAVKSKKHQAIVCSAEKIDSLHIQRFFGRNLSFNVNQWPSLFDPFSLENLYPSLLGSFLLSLKCDLLIDTFSNALTPWADAVYFNGFPKILKLPKGKKGLLFFPYKALLVYSHKRAKTREKILMACSKWAARMTEETTGLNTIVLHPPVSDFFKTDNPENQAKNNLVTTVTRISKDKNPEIIPLIARLVSNDFSFTIIGACKHPEELRILNSIRESVRKLGLQKRVRFELNVPRERQREILRRSKVYLHSTFFEAFGTSIIEAMASGCIPIVPNHGGQREIVPKQQRYNSVDEAASLINSAIANWSPKKAKESAQIADSFSQSRFNKEFLNILQL